MHRLHRSFTTAAFQSRACSSATSSSAFSRRVATTRIRPPSITAPTCQPPPFYLAFYRWIRDVFGAHAVIHLGKHGNLEWLPGKGTALSAACFPEVILQDLPNIYPYIINNPGEGTQAKRRSAAVIVDHLIPPMTQAGTYGELRKLEHLLDEYYTVQSLDPAKAPLVLERIGHLVEQAQLDRGPGVRPAADAEQLPDFLKRVDGYLCEIKEAQIRDGLHVLGRLPDGEQLVDFLLALVRVDNGHVPGLIKALAEDFHWDYAALNRDLAAAPDPSICNFSLQFAILHSLLPPVVRVVTFSKPCIFLLAASSKAACARRLSKLFWPRPFPPGEGPLNNTVRCLQFLWQTIWPRLQLCHQEIDHILSALAGQFVPPGPSGAPTRGSADILPTGRNFYSCDIRAIPTQTAWRIGCASADALLERHQERTGTYPESVALVVWGTSNMRTGGDDIAEILYLLGVRPRWDDANRRVVGLEAIPLTELGRPRIDVTVRISGLFRDAFPNLVRLLNRGGGSGGPTGGADGLEFRACPHRARHGPAEYPAEKAERHR